jgi:hypothetical protein
MAEKLLVSEFVEIEIELAAPLLELELLVADDDVDAAGVLLDELLLVLLQAATSSAAATAAVVSPALFADTEYNDVPRLFRSRHAASGMCEIRSAWPDLC